MKTRRKSYGETVKQKGKLYSDYNPIIIRRKRKLFDSSSSSSSPKMTSELSGEQDKFMLRYLYDCATGSKAGVGESYSYNWWRRLAITLSNQFGTSVGTDACISSSKTHENSRHRLKHPAMGPNEYQKILCEVYRKNKSRVLAHPLSSMGSMRASGSRSRGPMSGSGSGGPMRRGSRNSDCSTICCHPDHWSDWEKKVIPLLRDLYMKNLLTSQEVDAIATHFKFSETRVGITMFLSMNHDKTRAKYVKDTLAQQA